MAAQGKGDSRAMTEHTSSMDKIEKLQARIFSALDTISQAVDTPSSASDADALRARDADLIEELEATLAEERADLQMERETVASLQKRAAELQSELGAAQQARAEAEDALAQQKSKGNVAPPPAPKEDEIERLNARIESQDLQFQRLRAANAQPRESIGILRERNTAMLADVDAIDQAMKAELEALRSTRSADVDQMNTILEGLKPLVEGQAHA